MVAVTLVTAEKQSNGRRIELKS